jgi:hypothetical protein
LSQNAGAYSSSPNTLAATPQPPCGDLGELDDRQQAKLVEIANHQLTDWSFHSHPYRGLAGTLKVAQLTAL